MNDRTFKKARKLILFLKEGGVLNFSLCTYFYDADTNVFVVRDKNSVEAAFPQALLGEVYLDEGDGEGLKLIVK